MKKWMKKWKKKKLDEKVHVVCSFEQDEDVAPAKYKVAGDG